MKTNPQEETSHDDGASRDVTETPTQVNKTGGISIADLFFRIIGAIGALASAIAMGTTNETLPFVSQFTVLLFKAKYADLPTFTFFVVANSIVGGYLVLSIPISIFHIIRSEAKISRVIILIIDTVMLGLVTAGASAATAIVYLAHKGNTNANWNSICQQFDSLCKRISGSLIGSFATVVMLMLTIMIFAINGFTLNDVYTSYCS